MNLAHSRADVDALLERMTGTHQPTLTNRIGGTITSLFFIGLAITFLVADRELVVYVVVAALLGFAFYFLDEAFATLIVDARGFTRRSFLRRWHIAAHEIRTIELREASDALIIKTISDKTRTATVSGKAKKALEGKEVDVPIGLVASVYKAAIRRMVLWAILSTAVAIAISYWPPEDPLVRTTVLVPAVVAAVTLGLLSVLLTLSLVLMRFTPRQRAVVYLGVFVAVAVAIAIICRIYG